MVTRNRKFPTPNGYSRQHDKRDVERLVAEDLEPEPPNRLLRENGTGQLPHSRIALESGPRITPHSGLDLRAVTALTTWQHRLKLVLLRLGQRLLHSARRQGKRLFHWVAWK